MYSSMPRTRVNYRLDDRVLAALNDLAGKGKTNQFIEGLLITFLKDTGRLPKDFDPLSESRGGKRENAGKKKRSPNDPAEAEDSLDKDSGGSSESRSPADVDAIDSLPETTAGTGRKVKADVDAIDGGEYE